jgi:type I restriction enzyme S subunit
MSDTQKRSYEQKPKLRFPGFTDSWHSAELGPFLEEYDERVLSTTELPIYSSTRLGLKTQKDYYDGLELANDGEYRVVPPGYFVFRHMSDDGTFKFNINKTGHRVAVSKEYPVFTTVDLNSDFLIHLFNDSDAFKRFAVMQKKGGTRTRLYFSTLCSWNPLLPSPGEQQKIAKCLTSLGELITVESRKVGALKAHTQGLLQQLFPAEGETVPRLRFPEFRDAVEWCSDSLGEIFETSSGGTPSRSIKEYWNGGIPWITTSLVDFNVITEAEEFISERGLEASSAKVFRKGTILVAMYGQGKTRGKVAMLGIEAATNQACAAIFPRDGIDPSFVFLNLANRYDEMRELSNSGGQENLSQALIRELPFSFPRDTAEQRRIIDCLTPLTELISAEAHKIAAYTALKKGLMQQLFPAIHEAEE